MPEPIRVAQVMGKMLGGGVEAIVMNYYRHIDHTKIQFDFLVDSDSTLVPADEIMLLGGRVFEIPPYQNQFAYQRELHTLFNKQHWLIVHSHVNALSVFPLRAAKRAGVPVRIAHSHSTSNPDERVKTAMKTVLRTQANRYPTARFACGEYAGEWLFGEGTDFTVVPNAIDLTGFCFSEQKRNAVRSSFGISSNAFVMLHMGRFVEQKNHNFLLDVFAGLIRRENNAVLLLAGDGPLRSEILQKAANLGISDRVRFLGQRTDADALYSAADVFCLPSLYEGLPVVAVEAQASGLPLVMSDKVTREALITSRASIVALESDVDDWARAVLQAGANRLAPVTREDAQAISRYDIVQAAPVLTQKYLDLAKKAGVNVD